MVLIGPASALNRRSAVAFLSIELVTLTGDRVKACHFVSMTDLIGNERVTLRVVTKVGLVHQLVVEAGSDRNVAAC